MKGRKIISAVCFCMLLCLSVNIVSSILERKDSDFKYGPFKEQKQDFDILFIGTSHVLNGIYPMQLWRDFGMVSYNCGGHGNRMPTTYHMMLNLLEEHEPKLMVIDVAGIEWNEKIRPERYGIDQQHISFDWAPLTREKIAMTNFLFDDVQTRLEFIFPLSIYHGRWEELKEEDVNPLYTYEKGAETRIGWSYPDEFTLIDEKEAYLNEGELGSEYLKKMIEQCQDREMEVLLINLPYPASKESQQAANGVVKIAEEYKINYLNLQYENLVEFSIDCYDSNSHLNPSGAGKVTDYIGKYIKTNYDIPNRSEDENYYFWYGDYIKYKEFKINNLKKTSDFFSYMTLLRDRDFSLILYFKGDSEMLQWGTPPKLINNLASLEKFWQAKNEKQDYLVVIDRKNKKIIECVGNEKIINSDTIFGAIAYFEGNMGKEFTINYGENQFIKNENGNMADVTILVMDNSTGELVDTSEFILSNDVNIRKNQ